MKELKKKAVKRTMLDILKIIGCVGGGCVLIVLWPFACILIPHFWKIAVGVT